MIHSDHAKNGAVLLMRVCFMVTIAFLLLTGVGFGDPSDTCPVPELSFPTGWGSCFYAHDNIIINHDWECTYANLYEIQIFEIQRDTIDNVDSLTDPIVQTYLDTCTYNLWLSMPVYMDVYNWSSIYWRLRAYCDSVGWSDWTEFQHYRVCVTTPHLAYPANGAQIEYTEDITLTWFKMPCGGSYRVQVDNNADFSSPEIDTTSSYCPVSIYCQYDIDPQLPNGKQYWRVSKIGYGDWSYSRYFKIISPPVTSCPVLFSYDGTQFIQENPLLTACEASNYTEVVTDYYQVTQKVQPRNGMITFQLKELEDEITYLEEFELISVDHEGETSVGCSVDGRIFTYRDAVTPLSAVDHNGVDRLGEISNSDNELFVSNEQGYLIVTFAGNPDQGYVALRAPVKLPCPFNDPGGFLPKTVADFDRMASSVIVELLDTDGHWVGLPDLPSRQNAVDEIVLGSLPSSADGKPTTVRISWPGGFVTDRINQFFPADEDPIINTWPVSEYRLEPARPTAKIWAGFDSGKTLILKKGDVLEVTFDCGEPQDPNMTRDYIVRAVGRYHPDYSVFTGLVPGSYELYDAYPNPFNPTTTIGYSLPVAGAVRLEVFNLLGQKVATLVDEYQHAGRHTVEWNTTATGGEPVASGVYLYRLTAGDFSRSKKLILMK
ncbi:MAG: T9SS type A sorting domain-containing protein [candidate division Zixibacteria bacterium]|nr:T9SS type A sorting domain-containing protein [candidate division Zixibacteria bacterium]